jgi:hypothetical protein
MGVCMEVLIVDWAHLETVPAGQREALVGEQRAGAHCPVTSSPTTS